MPRRTLEDGEFVKFELAADMKRRFIAACQIIEHKQVQILRILVEAWVEEVEANNPALEDAATEPETDDGVRQKENTKGRRSARSVPEERKVSAGKERSRNRKRA